MLEKMFYWEISVFTEPDISWIVMALVGIVIGILLGSCAVRRRDEFKEVVGVLAITWGILHLFNLMYVSIGPARLGVFISSVLAALSPISTFSLLGFAIVCTVRKVKGNLY